MKKLSILPIFLFICITPIIYAGPRTYQQGGISNTTMRSIRTYLTLDPAKLSLQELEKKHEIAMHAVAQLPNRLRAKHQAEIFQKQQLISTTEYVPLAALTGQADPYAKTSEGHTCTYKVVQQKLHALATDINQIAQQLRTNKKTAQPISFSSVIKRRSELEQTVESFGRAYGITSEYQNLHKRLYQTLTPALMHNALIFVTQELALAQNTELSKTSLLQQLTTIRSHAIERIQQSGVLTLAPLLHARYSSVCQNSLDLARAQAEQLYRMLQKIIATLEARIKQETTEKNYTQVHRAYSDTLATFLTAVATPLQLIDSSTQDHIAAPHEDTDILSDDEPEETENEQSSMFSKRDVIGIGSALGLIFLYDFVIAPKMNIKQLGVAQFCKALYNRKNPFTASTDTATELPITNKEPSTPPQQPTWYKRFAWGYLINMFIG